mgnify:CR=1 FL=1
MNISVEEEKLICIYHTSDCRRTMARMLAALPDMDTAQLDAAKKEQSKQTQPREKSKELEV